MGLKYGGSGYKGVMKFGTKYGKISIKETLQCKCESKCRNSNLDHRFGTYPIA